MSNTSVSINKGVHLGIIRGTPIKEICITAEMSLMCELPLSSSSMSATLCP